MSSAPTGLGLEIAEGTVNPTAPTAWSGREVSCRECEILFVTLEDVGISAEGLVDGLPVTLDELRDPEQRIPWGVFVQLLHRFEELVGGPEEVAEAGTRLLEVPTLRKREWLAGLFTNLAHLFEYGGRWWTAACLTHVRRCFERLPDGRSRITLEIPAEYPGSETFFRLRSGMMRATPRLLGYANEAEVDSEIAPHRGVFTVTYPARRSLSRRLHHWRARRSMGAHGLEEAIAAWEEVRTHLARLDRTWTELGGCLQTLRGRETELLRARSAAHDLNNILTAVRYLAEQLSVGAEPGTDRHEATDELLQGLHRTAELTRQILDPEAAPPRAPLLLNEVIARFEPVLRPLLGEAVVLTTLLDPSAGRVLASRDQIERIVANLAINARDAMPTGGVLSLSTREVEHGGSSVASESTPVPGSYLCISVVDTGLGMDEETRARIFDPFFTTKAPTQGTGLGLATVHDIVSELGGRIRVHSRPGHGTTFEILLPQAG